MFTIEIQALRVPAVDEWTSGLRTAIAASLPAVAEALREAADRCFETQADPWGTPWAPLSDSTLEARARKAAGPTRVRRTFIGPVRRGERVTRDRAWTRRRSERAAAAVFGGKILIVTSVLRGSLHGEVIAGPNGEGVARCVAGGPAAAYAGVHQWGNKDGTIPARPFLALRGDPNAPTVELPQAVHDEVNATVQDAIDQFVARQNAQR